MSNIVDTVFEDVCLDERVADGIFRMDEEAHMDALRDYLVKRGLTREIANHVTNKMLEGQYPDRQAWRKEDGILVTWPSPKHKALAIQKAPGKYTDENPKPKAQQPEEPPKRPEPAAEKEPETDEAPGEKPNGGGNVFPKSSGTVSQGGQELEVEPPRGMEKPEPPPEDATPVPPPTQSSPRTPEKIAAEKEVVKQIMATDNNSLAKIEPQMNEDCRHQLNELYKKADELGYKEAITFLTPFIKP